MATTMPKPLPSAEVNSLDSVRLRPAKASLRVNASQSSLTEIVSGVIKAGSQKAAAIEMAIDPAQLSRQLETGNLTIARLKALSPETLARIGKEMVEQYGALNSPRAHGHKTCDQIQSLVNELRQLIDSEVA